MEHLFFTSTYSLIISYNISNFILLRKAEPLHLPKRVGAQILGKSRAVEFTEKSRSADYG